MKKIIFVLTILCSVTAQASTSGDLSLLNRFYRAMNVNYDSVSAADLTKSMKDFEANLNSNDQQEFVKIEHTLLSYQPLFYKNTGSIMYSSDVGYSYFQNQFVLNLQAMLDTLHTQYGKTGEGFFTEAEFKTFFSENSDRLYRMGLVDPTIPNLASKVFQEIDLYTPVSDGNGQASFQEIINYAMIYTSSNAVRNQIRNTVVPVCDEGLGMDNMGDTLISAKCFRAEFMDKLGDYLQFFPKFKTYFSALSPAAKHSVLVWLEHSSRRMGYNEDAVGSFDYLAVPKMLHRIEVMFSRFDLDQSALLDKTEVLNMLPVFDTQMASMSNHSQDDHKFLGGVFTYIFRYGTLPSTTTVESASKLAWWFSVYQLPTAKLSVDRGGMLNFMCLMATPEQGQHAEICAQ